MKKVLNVIVLLTLLVVSNVQAQNWKSLYQEGNATYDAIIPYKEGCAKAVYDAFFGAVALPYSG